MSVAITKIKTAAAVPSVAVIGCGNMGGAIVRGLRKTSYSDSSKLTCCDTDEHILQTLKKECGLNVSPDPVEAARGAEVVFIALKPKLVEGMLKRLSSGLGKKERPIVVSIAAGVTLKRIARAWGGEENLVRVMPNLPCIVQAGIFGLYSPSEQAAELVSGLLSPLGQTVLLGAESEIDAVTALSGSGPAFLATALEGMIAGGVKMGLTREKAQKLAVQTMLGSAKLLKDLGNDPAALQARVSSPGGTTIHGLHELEAAGVRGAFISAVEAATLRAIELSEEED